MVNVYDSLAKVPPILSMINPPENCSLRTRAENKGPRIHQPQHLPCVNQPPYREGPASRGNLSRIHLSCLVLEAKPCDRADPPCGKYVDDDIHSVHHGGQCKEDNLAHHLGTGWRITELRWVPISRDNYLCH